MKKLYIAATALGALAVAAPATAQYQNQNGYSNVNAGGAVGVNNRIARLEARIQAGVQSGDIDQREARTLRMQLRDITRLERQYSRNGLTQQERADLQGRVRTFRDQLSQADGRGGGQYGSNQGYGNGGYGNGNGQGGTYEPYCEDSDRGGLGGIIDNLFGGGGNNNNDDCATTTLRVGQRASGNLYGVPSNLRSRFRDGGGVYYRSDGRNIYQIDART
ncbi:MAG TPA: hypothetical protein VGC35_08495, partial [Allosphingosinicella sp.]